MTSVPKSCFAFAFAGLVVAGSGAQTVKRQTMTIPVLSCPVAITAQHGWGGSMLAVKGDEHQGIGQQIELTLNNPGRDAISAIRITVRGWEGKGHTLPAREVNSDNANGSRTLELEMSITPHAATKTDVWVGGLTSVQSIDLVAVKYAKGLSWRAPAPQTCRIAPDGIMLISNR